MAISAVPEPAAGSITPVALLPSAARTPGAGEGSAVVIAGSFAWIVFELVVSGVSGTSPTLNVWIQQSLDGVNWDDVVSFAPEGGSGLLTQVQTAGLPVRERDAAAELHTWSDATLTVGTIRSTILGRRFRAKWSLAGAGVSVTFQVLAHLR